MGPRRFNESASDKRGYVEELKAVVAVDTDFGLNY
jgi:hypothetical protein